MSGTRGTSSSTGHAGHPLGDPAGQLLGLQSADELAVEPVKALQVGDRRTGLDLIDGELLDQLVDRQDVLGRAG